MIPLDLLSPWDIDLASWIVQDGNYSEFCVGQIASFALQCYGTVRRGEDARRSVRRLDSARRYDIQGEVLYCTPDVWVVDFGIRTYCEDGLPADVQTGSFISGEISLGIDDYNYREFLRLRQGFPALGYRWRIDRILQLVAPLIPTTTPWGTPAHMRDMARATYTEIERTNAWADEDGHAEYILQCILLDEVPTR